MTTAPPRSAARPRHPGGPALLLAAIAFGLIGCAAPAPEPTPEPTERPVVELPDIDSEDPAQLLRQARRADPEQAAALQLRAAMLHRGRNEQQAVAELLSVLEAGRLQGVDRFRFTLLDAELMLAEGRPEEALLTLRSLPDWRYVSDLEDDDRRLAASIRARVLAANERWLAALREHILLDDLLAGEQRHANLEQSWHMVLRIGDPWSMAIRPELAREPELRGWLELAELAQTRFPSLEAQQQAVRLWQRRWEEHPAAEHLPAPLAELPALIERQPRQVALLLPLSGPLSSAGQAIRDGFMAAHFEALASGAAAPTILAIDSSSGDITRLYLDAIDQGAEVVIGPLAREAVRDLAVFGSRDIPILALNSTGGIDTDPSLIQFGLIPEDEGLQMAERAHADGLRRALVLHAQDPWAERVMNSFQQRFESLGGKVIERRPFGATGQITESVAESLLISESEARARDMRRVLAANLEFEPRRRRDLDFVAIAAEPVSARALKPALAYHFAGDLPVYASSHMYDGSSDRRVDADLDGIRFVDMPWRLVNTPLRSAVEAAWPESRGSAAAFYAMGADAWYLAGRLPQLQAAGPGLPGLTGQLSLGPDGRLQRVLSWAVLRNGLPTTPEAMAAPLSVRAR